MSSLSVVADPPNGVSVSLDARLVPHDSLGVDGFAVFVIAILAALCLIEGAVILLGHWVIGVFFAFDGLFLLLAVALFRRGRTGAERIVIGGGLVTVTRTRGVKILARTGLRIFGLNIEREDDPDYGCLHVWLRLRQQRVEVARDLSPAERAAFYDRLIAAIRDAGGEPRVYREKRLPLLPAAAACEQI